MSDKKLWRIASVLAAGSMILAACGNATPVIQTVVVKETSAAIKETSIVVQTKEVSVEKTVQVQVTAQPKADWSTPHPILSDLKVRQALATCVNRDDLISSVYPTLSAEDKAKLRMNTFIVKGTKFYDSNAIDYTYDITAAGKLLDDAGWTIPKNGGFRENANGDRLTLKFLTTNASFRQTWSAVMIKQLEKCGVQLAASYVAGAAYLFSPQTGLRRRDFELSAYAWVGQPDPGGETLYACNQVPLPTNGWAGQNYMGWCNQAASTAIRLANNTLDENERKKQYAIVQEEFAKDMVSLPLFQRAEAAAYNKNLKGIKFDATQYYPASVTDWELPGKDTVVLGLSQEPSSLFGLVEDSYATSLVNQFLFSQDITGYNYDYQGPGMVDQKLPKIDNGGAKLVEVAVKDGDKLVNSTGDIGTFKGGKLLDGDGKELTAKVKNLKGEEIDLKEGVMMPQLAVTFKFVPRTWSDGQAVSKADYQLGYKLTCDHTSGAVSYDTCDRTSKVDFATDTSYTITYVPGYTPPLYYATPLFGAYPAHRVIESEGPYKGKTLADVEPKDFGTLKEILETPLGDGPYILTKWDKQQRMVLTANPKYWGPQPKVKNLIIQFFAESQGAIAAMLQGTVDIIGGETLPGPDKSIHDAAAAGKLNEVVIPSATWEHLDINLFVK